MFRYSIVIVKMNRMPSPETRQVVAVIPHYNMSKTLVPLLVQVVVQKYDAVYVLDDHSTACSIKEVVAPFGSAVNLIAGTENRGAGANRNRILEGGPKNLGGAILHFIDADCELETTGAPAIARELFSDPKIGVVGGLINNSAGTQMEFNYFPRLSWSGGLSGMVMMAATSSGYTNPHKRKGMPRSLRRLVSSFPNPHEAPIAKNVFAVAEANMLIPYDVFASIKGFDDSLRFAEGQDLGFKLETEGLTVRFDPSIAVKHHAVILPDRKRGWLMLRDYSRLARKYGLSLRSKSYH